jgi:predicted transcriptional regulator
VNRDQIRFDFEAGPPPEYPAGLYGGVPPHSNATTSRAAAESVKPHATRLARLVLEHVRARGGLTSAEAESELGLIHQTASARLRELVKLGLVADSGETRPTPSGRRAIVWRAVEQIPA